MPRPPAKPKPAPKRGKKAVKAPKKAAKSPELTPLAREFEAKLRLCSPQEQKFVFAKLDGANNTDAAKAAGYSERTARSQGSRLLTRVDISDAIKAGWSARGLTPEAVLAGIREMLEFDPSEVMSSVGEVIIDWEEVLVSAVLEDVRQELEAAEEMLRALPPKPPKAKRGQEQEPDVYDTERTVLEVEVTRLRRRETTLAIQVRKNPDALMLQKVERLKSVPYIDLEKVQAAGKSKYIIGTKPTQHGRTIELVSHKDTLEMAGRAHGIFRENLTLTGPNGGPIQAEATVQVKDLTGDQIAQRYAAILDEVNDQ